MKITKIAVVTLFLLAVVFASLAFAQQKPATGAAPAQQALGVMILQLKSGMGLEFENYMKKDLLPAVKKAGMKGFGASKTKEFGVGDRYMFTWPITSLAELDGPDPFEKAIGPDGLVVLLANIQRCVEGTRTFLLNVQPDLSKPPNPDYVHKMGVLVTTTVAPGRTDEFEKNSKEMGGVIAKTNAKGFLVGKVGLGGNPNQYLTYVLFDNFADLEKFIPAYVKAVADAKIIQQPGVVTSATMEVYGAVPEMTIQ